MITEAISAEPWQFGPARKIVLPNRREQIRRERELRTFIRSHNSGLGRLLTPTEIAKVGKALGLHATPKEIEYAAARAGIRVGESKKLWGEP